MIIAFILGLIMGGTLGAIVMALIAANTDYRR